MARKYFNLFLFTALTVLTWYLDLTIEALHLSKIRDTILVFTLAYLFFKIFLADFIVLRVKEAKTRYSLNKGISISYAGFLLLIVGGIWIENVQALLVAYGLVGAGVAVALQDFFKNVAGGLILLVLGVHRVGDRVEIDNTVGDIIDIGVMYTTLLEVRNWVHGDQATGRLTIIPNGYVLSHTTQNFTKDNHFIWDEVTVPITYSSNWQKGHEILLEIADTETGGVQQAANEEISFLKNKYYLADRNAEPVVYMELTDNWIELRVRYITLARERRITSNSISKTILKQIEATDDITIASETMEIISNS